MSYYFNAKGDSKAEAILDAEAKFDKTCIDMPIHERDRDLVQTHLRNVVNKITDPLDDEEVTIQMNGYISAYDGTASGRITSCGCQVTASVGRKSKV